MCCISGFFCGRFDLCVSAASTAQERGPSPIKVLVWSGSVSAGLVWALVSRSDIERVAVVGPYLSKVDVLSWDGLEKTSGIRAFWSLEHCFSGPHFFEFAVVHYGHAVRYLTNNC